MERKSCGALRTILTILTLVGVVAAAAVVFVRMEKEIGALRYRLEQWMRLRQEPMTMELTED